MVAAALDALAGADPDPEAVAAALSTIPAAELPDALRLYAGRHGRDALPVLRHCLAGRPEWAVAAAEALAGLPIPEAAALLAAAPTDRAPRPVRTAVRRALYRLRQAGVTPPAPAPVPRPPVAAPTPREGWLSGIDGTGSRGVWLVLEGPYGERTLLSAVVNDTAGVLDFFGRPVSKRKLAEELRAIRDEGPLPWVAGPPDWALHLLREARRRHEALGVPPPGELARWLDVLPSPEPAPRPPIQDRLPEDPVGHGARVEGSAALLGVPDLGGWFLDPAAVQADALELLQAKESRLVVSEHIREERRAAVIDRVVDVHIDAEGAAGRRLWHDRLEEEAFVLLETGRPAEAAQALAVARALGDPAVPARRIPFVRALVERSLEVAGEVALGRVPADRVSRRPPPRPAALG